MPEPHTLPPPLNDWPLYWFAARERETEVQPHFVITAADLAERAA